MVVELVVLNLVFITRDFQISLQIYRIHSFQLTIHN